MDSVFFGYLEGEDREEYINEAALFNELDRFFTLYEMTELKHQQNIKDCEIKVLTESGTYDDLQFLLEAEATETGEQKKNIFQKIIAAIGGILSSIGNAIAGLFKKNNENPDEEVEVDAKVLENHGILAAAANKVSLIESNVRSGNWGEAAKAVIGIALPAAAVVGGTAAAVAGVKKIKNSDLQQKLKEADGWKAKFDTLNNIASGKLGAIGDAIGGKVKEVLDWIRKAVSAIFSHVKALGSSIKGAVTGENNKNGKPNAKANADVLNKVRSGNNVRKNVGNFTYVIDKNSGDVTTFFKGTNKVASDAKAGALPPAVSKLVDQIKSGDYEKLQETIANKKAAAEQAAKDAAKNKSVGQKLKNTAKDVASKLKAAREANIKDAAMKGSIKNESAEDDFIIIEDNENELIIECVEYEDIDDDPVTESVEEISTEESIFGAALEESARALEEKENVFESELNDLREMFDDFMDLDD